MSTSHLRDSVHEHPNLVLNEQEYASSCTLSPLIPPLHHLFLFFSLSLFFSLKSHRETVTTQPIFTPNCKDANGTLFICRGCLVLTDKINGGAGERVGGKNKGKSGGNVDLAESSLSMTE